MGLNDGNGVDATARLRGLMTRGGGNGVPGFGGVMNANGGQETGMGPGGGTNGPPPSLGALDRMGQGQGQGQGLGADQGRLSPMTNDQGATGQGIPDALKLPYERGDQSGGVNKLPPTADMNVRDPGGAAQGGGMNGADPGKVPGAIDQAPMGADPQAAHHHLRRRMFMKQAMQQGMPASLAGLHSLGFGNFGQGGY